MLRVTASPLPADAILAPYHSTGHYTDCFSTEIDAEVPIAAFIEAFYTTPLFKLERLLIKTFISKPSTDAEANLVANREMDTFAAWRVEQHAENQLLMCDISGKTRSWFCVEQIQTGTVPRTRLLFGSAVIANNKGNNTKQQLDWPFRLLLGFHKFYSISLLASARLRLNKLH